MKGVYVPPGGNILLGDATLCYCHNCLIVTCTYSV